MKQLWVQSRLLAAACLLAALAGTSFGQGKLPPLGDSDGTRLPGKFIWVDLVTDNVPAAAKFYKELFGWTFQDVGNYVIVMNDDRHMAGMFQRPRPPDPTAKPRWFGYISVASVDRAQRAVTKAGGRVLSPRQRFPGRGDQAVFADPEGALFGVIHSSSGDPQDFAPAVGDWIWAQLWSRDARKAAEFYRAVAGYEIRENTTSARSNDFVLVSEKYARGTVLTLPPERPEVRPTWLAFVRVANVAESVAKVPGLGGKVLIAPRPDLYQNRVAVVADPTGAAVGLLEWHEDLLKGVR
jgi:uncharacterized protein